MIKQKGAKKNSQWMTVVWSEKVSGGSKYSKLQYQGPKYEPKLKKIVKPQINHPYGTRSKTKATPVSVQSVETDTQSEQKGHLGLGQWVGNLLGTIKDATVWQISRAERWSP